MMRRYALSTTERGLGAAHRRLKLRMLPAALGRPCPLCGEVMLRGQQLELDHVVPRVLGGRDGPCRIVHARCNRVAGARLGNALRRQFRLNASRRW